MPLYPLVIGDEERDLIKSLIKVSEQRVVAYEDMLEMSDRVDRGEVLDGSRNNHLTIDIPMHYQATFTIEEHAKDRTFRHLSLSIIEGREGHGPTPEAMAMVMNEFGFRGSILDMHSRLVIYPETLLNGTFAINVLEPLQDN